MTENKGDSPGRTFACAPRTRVLRIVHAFLGFSALVYAASVFLAADNVYGRSAHATEVKPSHDEQPQNFSKNVGTTSLPAAPAFPLKSSTNNRYLVDQNNVPFLIVGDAPQALIANLSQTEAATYVANRKKYGVNTLWIDLLCNWPEVCRKDATTFDGIAPFTAGGNLSTPNPSYFQRADDMINIASENDIMVLLDPIETSGWLNVLRTNGTTKAFAYGQYLGNRYKNFPNIIWMHGNDFQSWRDAADDAVVQAVAKGIKSSDANHIHTVELDYLTSGSLDDPSWAPLVGLDAAYTYFPTYAQVLTEYNRLDFKPIFMVEANYEFEHLPNTDGGSSHNLRRQEYWTMLSGAAGQLYGSAYTWTFKRGWESKLDSPGALQLSYMKNLFAPRKWFDLVPDQSHTVVTAGYHSLAGNIGKWWRYLRYSSHIPVGDIKELLGGSIDTNTYATAARTSDGSLAIAYLPTIRTITVDMSKLAGPTTARWFDPTDGSYADLSNSPFANSGSREFTPPGNNAQGDGDWVLLLEASPAR